MTKPRFQVEKLAPYTVTETVYTAKKLNDRHTGFEKTVVSREVDDGYMVYFPHGHSVGVEGHARLVEMKLATPQVEYADGISVYVGDDRIPPPLVRAEEVSLKQQNKMLLAKHATPNKD